MNRKFIISKNNFKILIYSVLRLQAKMLVVVIFRKERTYIFYWLAVVFIERVKDYRSFRFKRQEDIISVRL